MAEPPAAEPERPPQFNLWLLKPNPSIGKVFREINKAVLEELSFRVDDEGANIDDAIRSMTEAACRIIEREHGQRPGKLAAMAAMVMNQAPNVEDRTSFLINLMTRLPDAETFGEAIIYRVGRPV